MKNLIKALPVVFCIFLFSTSCAQKTNITTFFLVRHAEKANDGTSDPDLNEQGNKRAGTLANLLKEADITAVYTTPYKRTRQTGRLVATNKGVDMDEYQPRTDKIVDKIMKDHQGESILIVGHSNSIPSLVNELIGEKKYQQLSEDEYDKLFIVSAISPGNAKVTVLSF